MLLRRSQSQLLVIDVQERLAPHIADGRRVVDNCVRLLGYARVLAVPATLTEHYPAGLGPAAAAVRDAAPPGTPVLGKIAFSSWNDEGIRARLAALREAGRKQVVVAGMEAHVCVGQAVLDLVGAGFEVFVVGDAVGSRQAAVRDLAVARLREAGAGIVAHEMVAFEWLQRGDDPAFKQVLEILR